MNIITSPQLSILPNGHIFTIEETCSWWKGFPCHQQSLHIVCKSFPKPFPSLFSSCRTTIWCDGVSQVCFEVLFSPHHTRHGLRLQCTMYHCAHCAMCSSLLCSSWINFWCVTYISLSPYSIVIVAFNMSST